MVKVKVKHYRNGITHYRAYTTLRAKGISHSAAWKYVQKYVTAPAFEEVSPTGGMTTVDVLLDYGLEFHGEAHCSMEDVFVKEIGVDLAMDRVLAQMEELAGALELVFVCQPLRSFSPCLVVAI